MLSFFGSSVVAGAMTFAISGWARTLGGFIYDGGKYFSESNIITRIHQMVEEGVDIIDVGAASSRPGAAYIDEKEEVARLSIAIEIIRRYYPDVMISIDTYQANVAKEIYNCLGPVIVNDISGGDMDEKMFEVVAETGAPYIMTHIQGTPVTMQVAPHYENVGQEVRDFLNLRIERLNAMKFDNIMLDPGFGFGKTLEHNYQLMRDLDKYLQTDYPLVVGISRKSMIYRLLGSVPEKALNGTTALNMIALMKGANILRVHDVKEAVETVKIYEKMMS
jgi:dihydropteroate synthase